MYCQGIKNINCHSIIINSKILPNQPPLKTKIKHKYIPKYRQKLHFNQTHTCDPSADRLSQLTTKQIDRLIDIQKIKTLLNQQKNGIPPVYINSLQKQSNKHPHVYKGYFMEKINKIAQKRNIKHLRSSEFDGILLNSKERRTKGLQMQKKSLKFVRNYRVDSKKSEKHKTYEQLEQKSISSIEESVSEFEKSLQKKRSATIDNQKFLQRYRYDQSNILSSTRWFSGMSTHYLYLSPKRSHISSSIDQAAPEESFLTLQNGLHNRKKSVSMSKKNTAESFKQFSRKRSHKVRDRTSEY